MRAPFAIGGVFVTLFCFPKVRAVIRAQEQAAPDKPERVVSLLEKVRLERHGVEGRWEYVAGVLVTDGRNPARTSFPYYPPQEYDYVVEFTSGDPPSCIGLLVSRGDVPFGWSLNTPGQTARLESINGHAVIGNPTCRNYPFQPWQKYVAELRVRDTGVTGLINGKVVLEEFRTDYSNLNRYAAWDMPNQRLLGVGAFGRPAVFHRVEVREITGHGTWEEDSDDGAVGRHPEDDACGEVPNDGTVGLGPTADKQGWVLLPPLVQKDRDTQEAQWRWDGQTAHFGAEKPRAYVSFPLNIQGSYELQTRVTITRAKEITAIWLPIVGNKAAVFGIRGDKGYSESATAAISLKGVHPAPQPKGRISVDIGTEYAFSCKVIVAETNVDIEVRRDDELLFQWSGDVSQIAERRATPPGTVALETAYYTTSRFRDLRLRMLSGQATPLY